MATYYISNSLGLDTRTSTQAQNPSTPWKNHPWDVLAASNSLAYVCQPNDVFIMRMGDTWIDSSFTANDNGNDGNLIITTSNADFGDGVNLPVLSGSWDTSGFNIGWTYAGGGIYSRPLTTDTNSVVYGAPYVVLSKNTITPSTPSVGEFGWASNVLYVRLAGDVDPATVTNWKVAKRNYNILASSNYVEFSNLILESANTTVGGNFYSDTQIGGRAHHLLIRHGGLHGLYCDTPNACSFYNNTIEGFSNVGVRRGILAKTSTNSLYYNNIVDGFTSGFLTNTSAVGVNKVFGNIFRNTNLSGTSSYGVFIAHGAGWEVYNNTIFTISDRYGSDVFGIKIETDANIVYDNTIYDVNGSGIVILSADGNQVYDNRISNCGAKEIDGTLKHYGNNGAGASINISGTSEANTVYNNINISNYSGIGISTSGGAGGNIIRNNIEITPIVNGIGDYADANPTNRNWFYNNLVYHSPSPLNTPAYTGHAYHVQDVSNGSGKVGFVNNTAYNAVANGASHCFFVSKNLGTVSVYTQNNNWFGVPGAVIGRILGNTYTDIASLATAERASSIFGDMAGVQASAESGSISTDPLFLSPTNYHLQPTSPCLNVGTTIAGITTDLDGNQYPSPNGASIGPYEDYPLPAEGMGPWSHFDGSVNPLALSDTSPANLLEVKVETN